MPHHNNHYAAALRHREVAVRSACRYLLAAVADPTADIEATLRAATQAACHSDTSANRAWLVARAWSRVGERRRRALLPRMQAAALLPLSALAGA